MTRRRKPLLPTALPCILLLLAAETLAGESFPGQEPDRRILKTQEKVDALFQQGKFERAIFIYRQELAPLGDKHAQYMVGYMHLAGKGVAEDAVTAHAWYRLAAERGAPTYARERDKLRALLDDGQRARSGKIYAVLRDELGDIILINELVEEDLLVLRNRSQVISFSQENSGGRSGVGMRDSNRQQAVNRINRRMGFLRLKLESDSLVNEAERRRFEELTIRVQRELRELEGMR